MTSLRIGVPQTAILRVDCYRTYERLQDYLRLREGDLFLTDEVRASIQAIYDHP